MILFLLQQSIAWFNIGWIRHKIDKIDNIGPLSIEFGEWKQIRGIFTIETHLYTE